MTDLFPIFAGIFMRATCLMGSALLLIGLLQRRRPLVASSLLTSTTAGLLLLPLIATGLPSLSIPIGTLAHDRAANAVVGTASPQDPAQVSAVATAESNLGNPLPAPRPSNIEKSADGQPEVDAALPLERWQRRVQDSVSHRQDGQMGAQQPLESTAFGLGPPGHWQLWLTTAYLLGVLIFAVRTAAGLWLIHRLRQTATVVNGDWERRRDAWQLRLGTNQPVEVRASEMISVPMTVGWLKPVILLPTTMLEALAPHQDAVLLHELIHIRRRDFAGLLLMQLAHAIYWCHPLTWALGLVGRHLRERACDDVCIHWMGAGGVYRNALLAIARQTICRPRLSLGLAMAHSSRLSRRLAQIDCSTGNDHCMASRPVRMTACLGMTALAALTALIHLVPREATAMPVVANEQPAEPKSEAVAAAPDQVDTQDAAIPVSEGRQAALENGGNSPESLVAILGSSKLKHWSYVNDVAWSPDGKMLGSVGGDGCLRLWDPDTGEQLKRFKSEPVWAGGAPHLTSLAFEPAGKHIAAGLGTNAVRVWEIETGNQTHLLKDDGPIQHIAWHPTRPLLATGGELVARLWDLSTGKIVLTLEQQDQSFRRKFTHDVVHVAFAPNGRHVIVSHPDGSIRYWNVETGEVTRTIAAHQTAIQALAVDAARNLVATGGLDGKLRLWRLSTGEPIREIAAHDTHIQGLAFHPQRDGIFSSGLDGTIRSWILRTGDKRHEFVASHSVGPGKLAMHPTRDLIASTGYAVRLWNSATGIAHVDTAGHFGGIQALAFTPDGSRLLSAGNDTTVRVWKLSDQTQLASYQRTEMPVKSLAVLPDGQSYFAQYAYQGQLELRTIGAGTVVKSWKGLGEYSEAVAVSPDGKWFAATSSARSEQGNVLICDVASGKVHASITTHRGHPWFSADGKKLLVVGTEHQWGAATKAKSRISAWNVETKEKVLALEDVQGLGSIQATALSADGGTLAIAGTAFDMNDHVHEQLVFWDWTKNATRLVIEMQDYRPDLMAFARDGRSVVTAAVRKGEVRVWDPRDGALRETINLCEGNPWSIGAVAYAADSRQFAAGMGNGTIYIVRPQPAAENVPLKVDVPPPFK
jgi:WD40 repeat protein